MNRKKTGAGSPKRHQVYCHCGRPAVLRSGKDVCKSLREDQMVYACANFPACNSYVLAHPDTRRPMGSLAGLELRRLRYEAHKQFDALHQSGLMTRKQAYQWLGHVVSAPMEHAHIGHLSEYYCKLVIEESKKYIQRRQRQGLDRGARKGGGHDAGTYSRRAGSG